MFTSITIPDFFYEELIACDVDPFLDEEIPASHHQLSQALLEAEMDEDGLWGVDLTEDALVHLINVTLPTHMEMWYSWNDDKGQDLIDAASKVLGSYDAFNPY